MIGEKGRIELCPCLKYLDNLKTSENSRLIISVKSRSVRFQLITGKLTEQSIV